MNDGRGRERRLGARICAGTSEKRFDQIGLWTATSVTLEDLGSLLDCVHLIFRRTNAARRLVGRRHEKLRDVHRQPPCNPCEVINRDVDLAAFDQPDVLWCVSGALGKLFLSQASTLSYFSYPRANTFPDGQVVVHAAENYLAPAVRRPRSIPLFFAPIYRCLDCGWLSRYRVLVTEPHHGAAGSAHWRLFGAARRAFVKSIAREGPPR